MLTLDNLIHLLKLVITVEDRQIIEQNNSQSENIQSLKFIYKQFPKLTCDPIRA